MTAVTCMTTEEWHVKTTPDKPIRDAVRISMGLPMLLNAVDEPGLHGHDVKFVDGGLMCNYPLHVFDGWCAFTNGILSISCF